jgi:hypothetical protein
MKPKKNRQGLPDMTKQDWSPQALGLDPARYEATFRYLFDRPVPQGTESEWFWRLDEPDFEATPLEWTRIRSGRRRTQELRTRGPHRPRAMKESTPWNPNTFTKMSPAACR